MNKKFTFILYFLLFFTVKSMAQCAPCPKYFFLTDSVKCISAEVSKNCSNGGNYVSCNALTACKNSRQVYTLTPFGTDPLGAPCSYPGIVYNSPAIAGGTIVSYGSNQLIIQWGGSNTGTILIPFSIAGGSFGQGCRDTIRLVFNLVNNPVAAFTASPQPACFNNPTNISFNSTSSVGAVSYFWNFGDGFTSSLANPVHAYTSPGTYTVCLVVSNSATDDPGTGQHGACPTCIDSICKTVVISNLPGPPIECVAAVCAGGTETYCTTATGCTGYSWTVTGGTITAGQNTPCVTVLWGSGNPQGTVTLVATGCTSTYCPQGTTVNVPIIPATTTISGSNIVCINTTSAYALPIFPGTTYNWSLSGGGFIMGYNTNTSQVNINWNTIGNYIVTCNYFDTALNCGGTGTINVSVLPVLKITGLPTACQGQSTTLHSLYSSPNTNVNCTWTISPIGATVTGGNGTSFATINWAIPGVYTVTATSTSAGVVCGNAIFTVTVFPSPIISAISGADSICPNKTYVYAATSNASGLFNWTITNGAGVYLGSNNDSVQITWGNSGPYVVSVQQSSYANNCLSNTFTKNVYAYPVPNITGITSVCADNIETYTITNIANGNFNWYVTPGSFGTIISGQGTNTVSIKWHGNNNPGNSNLVYLHFGVCGNDSIAVTINEPVPATITATGALCSGGVNLTTGATGVFSWSCVEHPISPVQPTNLSSLTGLNKPGNYNVVIQNFNGTGCTVTATYNIPNVGTPVAHISATNILTYCLPNLPNMSLVANSGAGYGYQWYLAGLPLFGQTTDTLKVNSGAPAFINGVGSYSFYCVVTLGGCVDTSNIITINVVANCPPGCIGAIKITNIAGCNPFTITIAPVTPPSAYIIPGTTSIFHWTDGSTVSGNVTNTFSTAGYQPIRIYATVKNQDSTTCVVFKDTTVLVNAAAKFIANNNCGVVTLTDLSTTVFPAVINSYNWTLGTNPGNFPTGNGTFNNNALANPVLTFTVSGSYIISQTITSGTCVVTYRDTILISIPNANFTANPSCVGTSVAFNNPPSAVDFWDFGDAATSYTSPTFHAYGLTGFYLITHIVTDVNGCKDTAQNTIFINPAPTCTITYSGPTTFCFGDSLVLNGCAGYTGYQWYNNGVAISGPLGTQQNYTALQTGNYSFFATDVNGCKVVSDTVTISVNQPPSTSFTASPNRCENSTYTLSVPNCVGCFYLWSVDNIADPTTGNIFSYTIGSTPLTVGTHTIAVTVFNPSGCFATDSVTVTFFANPTVSIAVAGNPAMLCSNNLYTFTATTNASSPAWAWYYNNLGVNLSVTNTLVASSAGQYVVNVTDGVTGCKSSASQFINASPDLSLFPIGCDTLCNSGTIFLPLGSFNGNVSGYTINWYDNAPPFTNLVGTGISLNLAPFLNNTTHQFSVIVTAPNGCMDTSNFYFVIIKCAVLSVKDVVLAAKQVGNYAVLNWSTNQEIENDYFAIERSLDGVHFTYVDKTRSKGNSNNKQYYRYNDALKNYNQPVYYRIRAVDKNGEFIYSNIVQLTPAQTVAESILVMPTVTGGKTKVVVQSNTNQATSLLVYNADGTLSVQQRVVLTKGTNIIPLDLSAFASGMYFIRVSTVEKVLTASVVKN